MIPIKKINGAFVVFILCLIFQQTGILAQKKLELDESDKARRKDKLIKLNKKSFINKTNERAGEAAKKADIETGKKLAKLYQSNPENAVNKGISMKRFESAAEGHFGGDVMEFTKNASFGHINAIVRVVSGYVLGMYEYNQEDSELLALYVVYYNLKHRNDQEYVNSNFSDNGVVKKDILGIPEKFEGWRGQTQILIPIEKNMVKGGGLDIATFELEDQVNPDIGEENQKKFAKLQNRKIKSEKEEVQQKYDAILKKEQELKDRKNNIEEKLAELMKDPVKNKAEIARLEKEKTKIDKELVSLVAEKKEIEEKLAQIARREEMRKLGFTSEKEYLAYLESQKKKEEPKPVVIEKPKPVEPPPAKVIPNFINFWQSFHAKDRIIAGRESVQIHDAGIVTIGYELPLNDRSELILYLFSSGELTILKSSEGLKLSPISPLVYYEGKIFVFEELVGGTFLTQLTPQLDFEFRSSDPIDPNSTVSFQGDKILVTRKQMTGGANDVMTFTRKDLSLVK